MDLGTGLLKCPRERPFLMSEVPLYDTVAPPAHTMSQHGQFFRILVSRYPDPIQRRSACESSTYSNELCAALHLRTTTLQKYAEVPRRARIWVSQTLVSLSVMKDLLGPVTRVKQQQKKSLRRALTAEGCFKGGSEVFQVWVRGV